MPTKTEHQPNSYEKQAGAEAANFFKWKQVTTATEKATKKWKEAIAAQAEVAQLYREAHDAVYIASQGEYYEELQPLRHLANQAADKASGARMENDKAQAQANEVTHNAANI